MEEKKMFKVISPIERRDGTTWWMRCGSGYRNKDESINLYVDALPLASMTPGKGITLQLREYTEQELRERAERSASYNSRKSASASGPPMSPLTFDGRGRDGRDGRDGSADSVPF